MQAVWTAKDRCRIDQTWNALTYCFVNYGRSAAILFELRDKLQICDKGIMPSLEWPGREKPYPYGVLVGADKTSSESFRLFDNFTTKMEFEDFSKGKKELFLVGRLKFGDIFKGTFEMGFCAVFNRETGSFLMQGEERYNYYRKISEASE